MIKEFLKELNGKRVEGELIKTIVYSLLGSAVLLVSLYFLAFRNIPDFIPKYGLNLFFVALSFALIMPAIKQIHAYRQFACMPGMMIGMTIGMVSSFLIGLYVSATNGMFFGAFFGIGIGLLFGIWSGKCCGIMGVMEGIMAGFMGGLMGGMTALMLLNDHLKIAFIFSFLISSVIIMGLSYMIYKETRELDRQHKSSNFFIVALTSVLVAVTSWFIVFGPRGGIFA